MDHEMRAVVTGATSGIGEAIARFLAATGMTVVMVGRSSERMDQARQRILGTVPDANLECELADLSVLGEVRELAERLVRRSVPDVVISNAAIVAEIGDITSDGIQRTLATNHLAPYLLLRSLIEPIGKRNARFVVVGASPAALARVPVRLDDLSSQAGRGLGPVPSFRPFVAYGRTKNMNTMFIYALARRLQGSRITVNGAHPGIIKDTRLGQGARGAYKVFGSMVQLSPFLPGPDLGADTPVWLATSPEVDGITGQFFVARKRAKTAPHTTDVARCDRLWDETAALVGLPAAL